MSDYSAVAPPPQQNFNQSTAFAAALQRAKQVFQLLYFGKNSSQKRCHYCNVTLRFRLPLK